MKTALELIEEVAQHPTLDEYLDRDPKQVTEQQRKDLIRALRAARPHFSGKGRGGRDEQKEAEE